MNEQAATDTAEQGGVWRPCNVPQAHRSPWCEGREWEPIAGDPAGPLNISLLTILSRPMACSKCAALLLMRGRK